MNCAQAETLLGAYATDSLPEDEATAFSVHIADCSEHAAKAAELRSTALSLAGSESMEPPTAVRARVLEAIAAEPQDAEAGAAPVVSIADPTRRREARMASRRSSWFTPNGWTAIAAALAVLAIGVGAWALSASNGSDANQFASSATAFRDLTDGDGERVGTVVYFEDDAQAVVFIEDLPAAGDGNSYQMWAIEGGSPVSLAVMDEGTAGEVVSVVPVDASSVDSLAITVEPAGGSDEPTTPPVFTAEI